MLGHGQRDRVQHLDILRITNNGDQLIVTEALGNKVRRSGSSRWAYTFRVHCGSSLHRLDRHRVWRCASGDIHRDSDRAIAHINMTWRCAGPYRQVRSVVMHFLCQNSCPVHREQQQNSHQPWTNSDGSYKFSYNSLQPYRKRNQYFFDWTRIDMIPSLTT